MDALKNDNKYIFKFVDVKKNEIRALGNIWGGGGGLEGTVSFRGSSSSASGARGRLFVFSSLP